MNVQLHCVHWIKLTNESKGKPEQKFDGRLEQFLESVFKEESKNFITVPLISLCSTCQREKV
jgi:hypothetical protein